MSNQEYINYIKFCAENKELFKNDYNELINIEEDNKNFKLIYNLVKDIHYYFNIVMQYQQDLMPKCMRLIDEYALAASRGGLTWRD